MMRPVQIGDVAITPRETKAFKIYLREIAQYEVLTPDQEYNLFQLKAEGYPHAREELIKHNLRFVVAVAKKFYRHSLEEKPYEFSDVVMEGVAGLVEAVDRYECTRGFRLISYAVFWIK